jgi:hypothetical protein
MRNALAIAVVCVVGVVMTPLTATADDVDGHSYVSKSISSMPVAFTENTGQWDERALFRANAGGATMWFTQDGAYYQFTRRIPDESTHASGRQTPSSAPDIDREPEQYETTMIKAAFVGANPSPRMIGQELMEYSCNYFIGNDPDKWRTDVPNYQAVIYEGIYDGIDLKYYGNGQQMEYDFVVSPGAEPSQILVQYEGTKSLSVNGAGELVVETDWGEVIEQRPVVYQVVDGDRIPLVGEYLLKGRRSFGFALPNGYDTDLPLVIDPTLMYATYLGGGSEDRGQGIAVDDAGCAYVTGWTQSSDFLTENPYQADHQGGVEDVFVTKLSSSGNSLVYSTYLGGGHEERAYVIAVDDSGCAYVTGWTESSDFPTENPYQADHKGVEDVFVTKLSSSGSSLVYSTYLGGGREERGYGIAVDDSGCAYVTGPTFSTDFPTENPYQTDQGNLDVFVTKLSSSGSSLVYSTYLGGVGPDGTFGVAADHAGYAYVMGHTSSTDFPTENPYQTSQGEYQFDVFVTKLSSSGNSLVYSTYLGGEDDDLGHSIAVDEAGCAYVTGSTGSSDFPTENPYQTDQGGDVFVTKFSSSGNSLIYSTYLGGGGMDEGWGIAVDDAGSAYVTGSTGSSDFPTENPYQTYRGNEDVFVTKLSSSGNSLIYSTYLGGENIDIDRGIAVDEAGWAYVTGRTYSSDFPTENPYQTYQGNYDVFVVKMTHECCGLYTGGITGNANCSIDGKVTLSDITQTINRVYIDKLPLCCEASGNTNGSPDCKITLSDITETIDMVYISKQPVADCMPECET